jgi:uncharacterized protein (TIGR03437 family)
MCCPQVLLSQAPRIDSIDPGSGPIAGGTLVTIRGVNLEGAALSLDLAAIRPQMATPTQLQFITPTHDNGIATVRVANGTGSGYAEFLYVPPKLKDLPSGYITTVAGIGQFVGYYRPATEAAVRPVGITYDRAGSLYLAEPSFNRISRVRPDGILVPFAGTGAVPGPNSNVGDGGPAAAALLNFPRGVVADSVGNTYIADAMGRVRRVDGQTGIITTIAGNGTRGGGGDGGPALQAQLHDVSHIATDSQGSLFVVDYDDSSNGPRIRKIAPNGAISTVAGSGSRGFSGDGGPAVQAQFDFTSGDRGGIAVDSRGNLYIADTGNMRIRKVDATTGTISTVAGPFGPAGDGCLCNAQGITVDGMDNVYYAYNGSSAEHIVKMNPNGETLAIYGSGVGFSADGTPLQSVSFGALITDLLMDSSGNLLYSDGSYRRVRRLNFATGKLESAAGIGPATIGATGPAVAALLNNQDGDLATGPSGDLLVGDVDNYLLRRVDSSGNISTLAGTGALLWDVRDSAPALESSLYPVAVKTDAQGRVWLSDTETIFRIDRDGMMRRVAGVPHTHGFAGDGGPALEAQLCQPWDVAVDNAGNFFIADTNNNRIRRVDALTGVITTVAGSGATNGLERYEADGSGTFCGDGGPATQACLNTPYGVALDAAGNLYIADSGNRRIRRVDASGTITTVVSNIYASKLVLDAAGNLYAGNNGGISRYDLAGVETRIAGSHPGFSGDGGPALAAGAQAGHQAAGIAIDAEGNVFFNDNFNWRVRAVRYGALFAPTGARVQPTGGTAQTAPLTAAFSTPLDVLVVNAAGQPAAGVRVEFSAPATGPSCTFSNGTNFLAVVTDGSGHATAACKANLQTGSYVVTATPLNAQASVPFNLTNSAPSVTSQGIFNAATRTGGPVAPGEFVIVSGNAIGPAQPIAAKLTSARVLSTSLGNAQVLFDGQPAPLLYASANQIYAIVPYAASGRASTQLQVAYQGVSSAAVAIPVANAAPGIFTSNSLGTGQAVVLNQDGRLNSATHPATGNSTIQIFATGGGITDPASVDGQQDPAVLPKPVLPVRVSIGGQDAEVVLVSAVHGEAAGIFQVSVRVPTTVRPSPTVALQISLGSYSSPAGTTVAVR